MGIPIKSALTSVGRFAKNNVSSIMTGAGVIGMGISIITAVKSTPLALDKLDEKADELMCEPCDLTVADRATATWKVYLPSVALFVSSAGLIVGGHIVQLRKTAAIASAAAITERAFSEFKAVAMEELGETGATAVREKLADRRLKNHRENMAETPAKAPDIAGIPDSNSVRCLEPISGRLFWSTMANITAAINEANAQMLEDGNLSLNDLNDYLGLDHIPPGDEIGWSYYRDKLLRAHFTARLGQGGYPLLVMDYDVYPSAGFTH